MSKLNLSNLFDLIKSLNKSEKRYFKVFTSKHMIGKEKKYVSVFNIIDKQTKYDEKNILKKAFITNTQLNDIKKHLYQLILRSEDSYYYENNISKKIKNRIIYTEILYDKGLYEQAGKVLQKTKHLAHQYEKYELLPEILKWERTILVTNPQNQQGTVDQQKKDAIYHEQQVVLKKLQNLSGYVNLSDNIHSWIRMKGFVRNKQELQGVEEFMNNVLLKDDGNALSNEAKVYFYSIYLLFHKETGSIDEWYSSCKKIVEILESSPKQFEDRPQIYLNSLKSLGAISYRLAKYDELSLIIEKMKVIPEKLKDKGTEDIRLKVFEYSNELAFNMYLITFQFDKIVILINDVEKRLNTSFEERISKQYQIVFYYNCIYFYFIQGEYKKALPWVNKLINDSDIDMRIDLYCFARIYNLIIHFELNNSDLLGYQLKSTYRYLHNKQQLYEFESFILSFIKKKLHKTITEQNLTNALIDLKEITMKSFEKTALDYFDFISWLESKIQNRPMIEILKEKSLKKVGKL